MKASNQLNRLIDVATPYWAGEAEVFTTYWKWDKRTRETDRAWLAFGASSTPARTPTTCASCRGS